MTTIALPRTFWRRFRDCRRGSSALEFALAIPVFLLLLAGVVEISMVMFVSVLAEGGLREASRYGLTGQVPDGETIEERLVDIVKEHTHNLIEITPANVTFKIYQDYDQIGNPEPYTDDSPANGAYDAGEAFTDWNGNGSWDADSGLEGTGAAGEIVLYKIQYQWAFLTPLFSVFGGDDGALDLSASIAIRNEPWDPSGGAT